MATEPLGELSPSARAKHLISNPGSYEEHRAQYDSDFEFYKKLRHSIPCEEFRSRIQLDEVFIGQGDERVQGAIEMWLPNTIAKSILKPGWPKTLSDVDEILTAYDALDVTTPDQSCVVGALIDYLHDDDWDGGLRVVTHLTRSIPESTSDATVRKLERIRACLAIRNASDCDVACENVIHQYASRSRPINEFSGSESWELIKEAKEAPVETEEKYALYEEAACVSPDRGKRPFCNYMFYYAREQVERMRHAECQPVTRADLLESELIFDTITDDVIGLVRVQPSVIESYRHLARAHRYAASPWITERSNNFTPEYGRAAEEFAAAADAIRMRRPRRFFKYVSKAYRHWAHDAGDPCKRVSIHQAANRHLIRIAELESIDTELLQQTLRYHHMCKIAAGIDAACESGDYRECLRLGELYEEFSETIDRGTPRTQTVSCQLDTALGCVAEMQGDYERAVETFANLDTADGRERAVLSTVLRVRAVEDDETALKAVQNAGVEFSLVEAVLTILSDTCESVDEEVSPRVDELPGVDSDTVERMENLVALHTNSPEFFDTHISPELRHLLNNLQ